jgi:hypothetical protein
MNSTPPNLGPCDGCRTPTDRFDSDGTPYCAACVETQARSLKVQNDLCTHLEPVIEAWAKRWQATGYPVNDLTGIIVDLPAIFPGPLEWVQASEPTT